MSVSSFGYGFEEAVAAEAERVRNLPDDEWLALLKHRAKQFEVFYDLTNAKISTHAAFVDRVLNTSDEELLRMRAAGFNFMKSEDPQEEGH